MIGLDYNLIHGLMFGITHIEGDDDDDYSYCIALGLGFIQVILFKFNEE